MKSLNSRAVASLTSLLFLALLVYLYSRGPVKVATISNDETEYTVRVDGLWIGSVALIAYIVLSSALVSSYLSGACLWLEQQRNCT